MDAVYPLLAPLQTWQAVALICAGVAALVAILAPWRAGRRRLVDWLLTLLLVGEAIWALVVAWGLRAAHDTNVAYARFMLEHYPTNFIAQTLYQMNQAVQEATRPALWLLIAVVATLLLVAGLAAWERRSALLALWPRRGKRRADAAEGHPLPS